MVRDSPDQAFRLTTKVPSFHSLVKEVRIENK